MYAQSDRMGRSLRPGSSHGTRSCCLYRRSYSYRGYRLRSLVRGPSSAGMRPECALPPVQTPRSLERVNTQASSTLDEPHPHTAVRRSPTPCSAAGYSPGSDAHAPPRLQNRVHRPEGSHFRSPRLRLEPPGLDSARSRQKTLTLGPSQTRLSMQSRTQFPYQAPGRSS